MTMDSGYAEVDPPEPTDDHDEPNQDQDAGVGDAEIEYDEDPFAEGDAE
jgi:hypothetical protein